MTFVLKFSSVDDKLLADLLMLIKNIIIIKNVNLCGSNLSTTTYLCGKLVSQQIEWGCKLYQ